MAKIALVTGSSRGLGKNTALALAKKGVDVIVTYHSNLEEANKVVSAIEEMGAKAKALQLDNTFARFLSDDVVSKLVGARFFRMSEIAFINFR